MRWVLHTTQVPCSMTDTEDQEARAGSPAQGLEADCPRASGGSTALPLAGASCTVVLIWALGPPEP